MTYLTIARLTEDDANILMGRQTLPLEQVQEYRDADRNDAEIMFRAQTTRRHLKDDTTSNRTHVCWEVMDIRG